MLVMLIMLMEHPDHPDNNILIIYLFTAIGLSAGGSGYFTCKQNMKLVTTKSNNNNNNNNIFIYLLQLVCHPVAVVILHVYKTWNWLLLN